MTAFHNMMLSGHGLPEMPPGGSLESRLKSRIRRLLQFVDYKSYERWIREKDKQNELTMAVVTNEEGLWAHSSGFSALSLHPGLVSPLSRDHPVICLVSQECNPVVSARSIAFISISEMRVSMQEN